MSFIKIQKLVLNEDGSVRSGSAAIMDTVYVKDGKYHSKQVQREKLGKIVSLDSSKRRGVFMSPTRGLVGYDVDEDRFFEPGGEAAQPVPRGLSHKVFGDTYLALEAMRASGYLWSIRSAFEDDRLYEGVVLRAMHRIAADGSGIPLKPLVDRSFVSGVFSEGSCGGRFFSDLGSNASREGVREGLRTGRVPFYSDATDYRGPRMMIEFDGVGGKPVGCDQVVDPARWPLDHMVDGVAILGEDYVSESLFKAYGPDSGMTFIAAMPSKKGYPYKDLCQKALKHLDDKDCIFERDGRTMFAMRKKVEMFGKKAYAYVCSDMGRSGAPSTAFQVLVSNKSGSPDLVAEAFASGVASEAPYRSDLPFDMPADEIRGRTLCDFISQAAQEQARAWIDGSGIPASEALGIAQSALCAMDGGWAAIEMGAAAAKMFAAIGLDVPERISLDEYRKRLMEPAEP